MPQAYLAFCPYLSVREMLDFAQWQLGPLEAFDDRWADAGFQASSRAFLEKFVDARGARIANPCLICSRDGLLDGRLPEPEEIQALETAIAFAFLDENPRRIPDPRPRRWNTVTADNTDPFFWPIDLESGWVTVGTGYLVRKLDGGYQIHDPELVIRPPIDLYMPLGSHRADPECLEATYVTVLRSLSSPGTNSTADRLRVAIGWLIKAWRNTASLHSAERVVFLKTAFEAITGTSKSYESARYLRELFESIPDTTPRDSEWLLWSPDETPVHTWRFRRGGREQSVQITDLEHWFMEFAQARNTIIHNGTVPPLVYSGANPQYGGSFFWTAEYLLRVVVKVSLGSLGYQNLWRSERWRIIQSAYEDTIGAQQETEGEPLILRGPADLET